MVGAAAISLESVTIGVGSGRTRKTLLEDVTASFARGELTAIVGPSGTGKTTLFRVLAGLHPISSGDVIVGGASVSALSRKALTTLRRRTVTTVAQDYNLIDVLTARENIQVLCELAGVRRESRQRADTWLEKLGIAELADEAPTNLSGGEQQRVAIARSLASPHPVVLADEPTGALDPENARSVVQLLHEFADAGKCCVVVTHDPDVAAAADTVLHLRDKQLAA